MGSFGGGGGSKTTKIKAPQATPLDFLSDYGDVAVNKYRVKLIDKTPEEIKQSMDVAGQKELGILQGLPTSTSTQEFFNNPFTQALRTQLLGDFDVTANDQRENLRKELAARGSLNNSAGIYAMSRQNEAANRTRSNINAQAALGGADAYTQNLGNMLSVLQNLQRSRLANLEQAFAPVKLAAGYQSAVNPITTANANAQLQAQLFNAQQGGGGGGSGLFSSMGSLFGNLI